MPAGVTWGRYLRFTSAAMITMFMGAQLVHVYYRPLDDLDKLVKEELLKYETPEENKRKEDVQRESKN